MSYAEAFSRYTCNKATRQFPSQKDSRARPPFIFPSFTPREPIAFGPNAKVFTIGSCFARNIEEALLPTGTQLPTMNFVAPPSEWPARPNGMLNEYNPGAMSQRILYALDGKSFAAETVVPTGTQYTDLLLPGGANVTQERALERRGEIQEVYSHLATSNVVVITLGLVEAWFDEDHQLYLNQIPPHAFANKNPKRFSFRRLDVDDVCNLLTPALAALADIKARVIITVSPVPLWATFTGMDCAIANEFSKSVLRVAADRLGRRFANIDYFPSYEIVRSAGTAAYVPDNVHVKEDLVHEITKYMIQSYQAATIAAE